MTTRDERLIEAAPKLFELLRAIVNSSHPRAEYYGGKATHYLTDKSLIDDASVVIREVEGR